MLLLQKGDMRLNIQHSEGGQAARCMTNFFFFLKKVENEKGKQFN